MRCSCAERLFISLNSTALSSLRESTVAEEREGICSVIVPMRLCMSYVCMCVCVCVCKRVRMSACDCTLLWGW